jgi:hypothetical protein
MPTAEYDLRFLEAAASQLENYLLSHDLYWPIGVAAPAGTPPYPRMTLGAMHLALLRARARATTPQQQAALEKLSEQIDATRSHWRVAWGKKAAAEFHSRLNLWRDFLEEYRANPDGNADRYRYEVNRRAQLQLLQAEAENIPPAESELFRGLDQLLRSVFTPDGFIWEPELEASFPEGTYWYLYGNLKPR